MTTLTQIKYDNKTIERVKAILFYNNICFTSHDSERIISIELYTPSEFRIMQRLLPISGNSAIGRALTHKPPFIPRYRPDLVRGAYRILLQCRWALWVFLRSKWVYEDSSVVEIIKKCYKNDSKHLK